MGKTQKRYGFTLVELLVVLLILGVLVGLAVPRYMDAQKNARFRTFTANVREIQSTLEVYRMDKTSTGPAEYPDNLSELTSYFTQPPINPYTGESMLSDNPEESGLQYTNNGSTYTLTVVQRDVDDVNKNGDTTEPLPIALNVASETETPTVPDNQAPVISDVTLGGETVVETEPFNVTSAEGLTLSFKTTDNVGVTYAEVKIDSATHAITPVGDVYSYRLPVLGAGNHTITITVRDAAWNEATFIFTLVVPDTEPPVIFDVTLGGQDVTENGTVTLNTASSKLSFKATDNVGVYDSFCGRGCAKIDILTTRISFFNISVIPVKGVYSYTLRVDTGTYTISIKATDAAGNEATFSFTLVVDTEPPIILAVTLTGTVDGKYGTYNILYNPTATINVNDIAGTVITVTATDNVGVSSVIIEWGAEYNFETGEWSFAHTYELTPSVTPGTWQYTFDRFDSFAAGQHVLIDIISADAAGLYDQFGFVLVVTE